MNDRIKVLIIEDNPGDARLVREMLAGQSDFPAELEWREDLASSFDSLGSADAVLLDLNLPDSMGLATVVKVVANAPWVPVVVVTGQGDETLALKALRSGAQDYLVKGQLEGAQVARAIRYAMARIGQPKEPPLRKAEAQRLKMVASELDSLEAARTAEAPAGPPQLVEVLASLEQAIRHNCVMEEKVLPEGGQLSGVEKMGAGLLVEHRQLLGRLKDLDRGARETSQAVRPLSESSGQTRLLLSSLRRLLDDAWVHTDKEDEFLELWGRVA